MDDSGEYEWTDRVDRGWKPGLDIWRIYLHEGHAAGQNRPAGTDGQGQADRKRAGIGAGAVIGGVVGGVLGHQVGGGTGQDIATAAGVVGGAVVGHEIEKRTKDQQESYRIRVRLDNGNYQTENRQSLDGLRMGDRVRIENDVLYRH